MATQTDDPASLLSAYRDLIHLRAEHPALAGIETVLLTHGQTTRSSPRSVPPMGRSRWS